MTQPRLPLPDPPIRSNVHKVTHIFEKDRRQIEEIGPPPTGMPEWTDDAQKLEESPNPWESKVKMGQRIWRWGKGPWYSEEMAVKIEEGRIPHPPKGAPPWTI